MFGSMSGFLYRLSKGCAAGFLIFALWQFGSALYLFSKAALAQTLIAHSWQRAMNSGEDLAPWPWADTRVVAELQLGNETHYVLSGATGRVLAFGPGHLPQTPLPGEPGNTVIAGHRDTHFAVLQHLSLGDEIRVVGVAGEFSYTVTDSKVVPEDYSEALVPTKTPVLTLITCYPFNSSDAEATLRYVVRAVARPTPSDVFSASPAA